MRAHVSLVRGVVVVSRVRVAPGLRGSAETSAPAECARLSRRARRRAQPCGDAEPRLRNVSHAIVRSCVVRLRRVFPRCARVRPREGACRGCIHAGAASNVCVYTFVYTGLYTLSPRAYRARERGRPRARLARDRRRGKRTWRCAAGRGRPTRGGDSAASRRAHRARKRRACVRGRCRSVAAALRIARDVYVYPPPMASIHIPTSLSPDAAEGGVSSGDKLVAWQGSAHAPGGDDVACV